MMGTTSEPRRRRYRLTPDRLVVTLLAVECILLLYDLILHEWFQCYSLGGPTGGVALLGAAVAGLMLVVILVWFLTALLFGWQFQLSLRSLFVLTIAAAVGCSLLVNEVRREKSWVAPALAIKAVGGRPGCRPTWLGRLLKDPSLTVLFLVDLGNTRTTDEELTARLQGVMQLQVLWLSKTNVSDAGLGCIQESTQLCDLSLDRTRITDRGLVFLRALKRLHRLDLGNTKLTGAGLIHIAGLGELEDLSLSNVRLSDGDLVHLRGLKQLKHLYVGGTPITDAGLIHLRGLCHLINLDLRGTNVTEQGVNQLQQALPNCEVFW
jgi:hypothetical protein